MARDWAIKAFSHLREYQDYYVLLSASGRGYHVFIFSLDERTEKQEVGRAIRVPGSFNPSTGNAELIVAETIRPLLDRLILKSSNNAADSPLYQPKRFHLRNLIETREADNSSSCTRPFFSTSTAKLIQDTLSKHPIKAKSTRNSVLLALIGELSHKFGRQLSQQIVRQHYNLYKENVTTPLKEHMDEFTAAWENVLNKSIKSMSQFERQIYDQLKTEPQREAFLLIRSFSKLAEYDFPVALASLADRLSITQAGASCVISKLVELGAIEKTAATKINSKAARYRWTANIDQPF